MLLRRPYGTPERAFEALFPTLKRGANKLCAYGAFAKSYPKAIIRR
jgi:hypothetical protein